MTHSHRPRLPSVYPPAWARHVAVTYLILQGSGGWAWWGLLMVWPASRRPFMAAGAPEATLLAFAAPDLLLFAGASWLAAGGLHFQRPWVWPVLCLHCGATVYAALYCLALWRLDGHPWLAALLMAPPLVVVPLIAWLFRPASENRSDGPS